MNSRPLSSLHHGLRRSAQVLALVMLSLCVSAQAHAERYAYVDLARAVFEVEDGKAAKARLEAMMKQRQKALDAKQTELKQMQESLQKQAEFMSEEIKKQKAIEFRTKLTELQTTYSKLQQELAGEEAKIQRQIIGRMSEVLSAMGDESSYSMIVRKDALLWAPSHLDITNELIRRYNSYLSQQKGNTSSKKKPRKSRKKKRSKKRSK